MMKSNDKMNGFRIPKVTSMTMACAVLLAAGSVGIPACADKKESATSPCPCAAGNVCCSAGVCAKDEASCGEATLALAQEAAGTWTGYFENFSLASGSDALKISIAVSGQTTSGQVVVGTGSPPPPPTDKTMFWPPGSGDGGSGTGNNYDLVEGFVYQAQDIRWESRRLKFRVALADAYQPLCDLFTPITVGGRTFICPRDSWGWSTTDGCRLGDGTPVPEPDCSTLRAACSGFGRCSCGETSCTANVGELNIDVALRGNDGDGSATGVVEANIRLIRSHR